MTWKRATTLLGRLGGQGEARGGKARREGWGRDRKGQRRRESQQTEETEDEREEEIPPGFGVALPRDIFFFLILCFPRS